jgi:hypothetical protein
MGQIMDYLEAHNYPIVRSFACPYARKQLLKN